MTIRCFVFIMKKNAFVIISYDEQTFGRNFSISFFSKASNVEKLKLFPYSIPWSKATSLARFLGSRSGDQIVLKFGRVYFSQTRLAF